MRENNSVVAEYSRTENNGSLPGYEELLAENISLRIENHSLHRENEKFREIFRFASIEFEKKNKEIEVLRTQDQQSSVVIKKMKEENAFLKDALEKEKGKVNFLNKMAFGSKNEKKKEPDIIVEHKSRGAKTGHKGRGRKIPKNLPVKEEIIDIQEQERVCSDCGLPYADTRMEEQSSEIDVEPECYYVKRYRRKVYKKTCTCPHPIMIADVPGKLIPKGKFSLGFWVNVLINKYKNHLPIERQIKQMAEYGLTVSNGTIFGGLKKIHSFYLDTLYQALIKSLREAGHIHADESGWKVFVFIDEKCNFNWFVWVCVSKDVVVYVLDPSRSAKVPLKTLFDIDLEEIETLKTVIINPEDRKVLSVDKFSSYKMLERMGLVELSFCWAHQRREFIDAGTKYPELGGWVKTWVEIIANLYHINNQRIKYKQEEPLFKEHDAALRKKISEIYCLINTQYSHPAQTAITNSIKEHWKGLTLFIDNPEIPMDNNLSERMIRPAVLGRKNYWGNHSLWAGTLTVTMFSIIQTCILNHISPTAYLTYYLTECTKRGAPPSENEIESFLPHKLNEELKEKLKAIKPEKTLFCS